jgi:hypothetical protein
LVSIKKNVLTGCLTHINPVTPLEMIKVRQQTEMVNNQSQRKYHGLINTASIIIRQEGQVKGNIF